MGKTLFDKIWDSHVITDLGSGFVLLHIDRLLLHDMSGGKALKEAIDKGYPPAQPRLTVAAEMIAVAMTSRPTKRASIFDLRPART